MPVDYCTGHCRLRGPLKKWALYIFHLERTFQIRSFGLISETVFPSQWEGTAKLRKKILELIFIFVFFQTFLNLLLYALYNIHNTSVE